MRGTPCHYFQSLNRPNLILGVEKRLFFLMLAMASSLVLTSLFKPLMLGIGAFVFCAGLMIGKYLTTCEPSFLSVYQRHLRYQRYYDPIPHLLSPVAGRITSIPRSGKLS